MGRDVRAQVNPAARLLSAFAAVVLLCLSASASAQVSVLASDHSDDGIAPFYRWQGPIPAVGRLLRSEVITNRPLPPGAARGQRILYSSTSDFGVERAIVASGTVYVPAGKTPDGGWPVMLWAHGTVGTSDVCAPSWTGPDAAETAFLSSWLSRGYAIVAADYEGLGTAGPHPYMALGSAGRTILDAARATRKTFDLADRFVVAGHSQGAHAAFGTGLLQPEYAPELPLRAVLVSGLPGEAEFQPFPLPDQQQAGLADAPVADDIPRDSIRALRMATFDPWFSVYLYYTPSYGLALPDFDINRWFTPAGRQMASELATACRSPSLAAAFRNRPAISTLLKRDISVLERGVSRYRRYPALHFTMPVYVGIGLADELTAPALSFHIVRDACRAGSPVLTRFYAEANHAAAKRMLAQEGPDFADEVLQSGSRTGHNCQGLAWPGYRAD
jgi:hypothetical protein